MDGPTPISREVDEALSTKAREGATKKARWFWRPFGWILLIFPSSEGGPNPSRTPDWPQPKD